MVGDVIEKVDFTTDLLIGVMVTNVTVGGLVVACRSAAVDDVITTVDVGTAVLDGVVEPDCTAVAGCEVDGEWRPEVTASTRPPLLLDAQFHAHA